MSGRKKGLKKGTLAFLLSGASLHADFGSDLDLDVVTEALSDEDQATSAPGFLEHHKPTPHVLDIVRISAGSLQPRKHFAPEALQELAESIKAQGVIQPIVVRPSKTISGGYELIAGERRWRAAQMAGLTQIPAVIRDVGDNIALAMAIIENIQRENLNPLEEARGFERLMKEFEMTQQQIAEVVGRSRSSVTNLLRLLHLDPFVQQLLEHGDLEMGHARALLALPITEQGAVARKAVSEQASVRDVELWVRRALVVPVFVEQPEVPEADPNILHLQTDLSSRLGAKVSINHGERGRGKVVIQYHSLDELDGILSRIH
jgi:ParB family chromosome partitioning protein